MNKGRRRLVDPRHITPLHSIDTSSRTRMGDLRELMRRLTLQGWQGRPLVVEDTSPHRYQAWTGTHRLAAARRVGLRRVPVVLIDKRKWIRYWGPAEGLFIDEVDGDRYLREAIGRDFDNIKNALAGELGLYVSLRDEIGEDLTRYVMLKDAAGDDVDRFLALRDAGDKLAASVLHEEIELNLSGDAQRCL
jgi:hypothetical protein